MTAIAPFLIASIIFCPSSLCPGIATKTSPEETFLESNSIFLTSKFVDPFTEIKLTPYKISQ